MVEGKVLSLLSFFHMEKQRTLQRRGGRRKMREVFVKRPWRASMGESRSDRNFLGPLRLLCEHPPSLHVPSTSFSFLTWPKWRQALCCPRAGSRGAAQAPREGLRSSWMSLAFAISFGLAQLETCICSQADYCSCRSSWPLLSFIFFLPHFHRGAIISQGLWGECVFSFILLNSELGRSTFPAEAFCSAPAD